MTLAPREYSKRLGVLTGDQLQAALDRFELGKLLAAEPAPGGLFGQNVFVTSTSGDFVLRGCPHSPWQLPKERWFARQLAQATRVPVPWPYRVDASSDVFGWSYAWLPRLEGVRTSDPNLRSLLSREDARALAAALGECLAELHVLSRESAGEYDAELDGIRPVELPFRDWVVASVREWLRACRAASTATTDDDAAWVEREIARALPALEPPERFSFVHRDFKEGNAVAERVPSGWRICGVFDLMEGYFGDPEEDFPRALGEYLIGDRERANRFLDAYRARRPLRPGFAERQRLYLLRDRMLLWAYGQRNGIWFRAGQTLREFAEPFIEATPE